MGERYEHTGGECPLCGIYTDAFMLAERTHMECPVRLRQALDAMDARALAAEAELARRAAEAPEATARIAARIDAALAQAREEARREAIEECLMALTHSALGRHGTIGGAWAEGYNEAIQTARNKLRALATAEEKP